MRNDLKLPDWESPWKRTAAIQFQAKILNDCLRTLKITTVNDFWKWFCCHSNVHGRWCLQTEALENSRRFEFINWNLRDAFNEASSMANRNKWIISWFSSGSMRADLSPGHIGCDKLNNAMHDICMPNECGVFKSVDWAETKSLISVQLAYQTKTIDSTIGKSVRHRWPFPFGWVWLPTNKRDFSHESSNSMKKLIQSFTHQLFECTACDNANAWTLPGRMGRRPLAINITFRSHNCPICDSV